MVSLKREFLELLEKDLEFRYTVAGYLGLSEVLKRLDCIGEEQINLRKEQTKIWEEIRAIKEEQTKIWEEIRAIKEEQTKIWEEIRAIKEEQNRLREDFNNMLSTIKTMNERLSRVERTLEKLTVDVEDEARSILRHRIKTELGIDMELYPLTLPDLEFNLYGASDNLCVIGEATVRGGISILEELIEKMERLKRKYPERLRRNVLQVLYVCLPLPELIEGAKEKGIWLLKATQDFHKPPIYLK
jgi:chromosome segregation ATPase